MGVSRFVFQIDQTGLGLGKREYYLEKNHSHILEAYREYMLGTAVQLGKRILFVGTTSWLACASFEMAHKFWPGIF